ncbi:MAG: protein kinase family protein [Acidimicrobiales bacterium]
MTIPPAPGPPFPGQPPEPEPFSAGSVLGGRYLLDRRVADDGLTERWTASDRVLARGVMVEVLSPRAAPGAREAFLAAVAAAARLIHPGIVSTYDSGVAMGGASLASEPSPTPGLPYVVTERPRGESLAEVISRQGALPAARVVPIGRQLARALEAAHRAGVAHTGIEPATVLLAEDERVKLARFAACGARARLRGVAPDAMAVDVRDLAATLAVALVGADASRPVSPRQHRPSTPPALDRVLLDAQSGAIADAARLAVALEELDVADDAEPEVVRERTPVLGTPALSGRREPSGVRPDATRRVDGGGRTSRPSSRDSAVLTTGRAPSRAGSRSGTIGGIVVGLLLLVAVAVAAFVLSGRGGTPVAVGPTSSTVAGTGRAGLLGIIGGHSFNPLSPDDPAKRENEGLVPRLYDGDPATTWSTAQYTTRNFGNLKTGTGVYVQLDQSHTLHQLTVTSPTRGWALSVYAAAEPGIDLNGWGRPVAAPVTVTTDVTQIDLGGAKGAAVLVWITQLGDSPPYHVEIGELALR